MTRGDLYALGAVLAWIALNAAAVLLGRRKHGSVRAWWTT